MSASTPPPYASPEAELTVSMVWAVATTLCLFGVLIWARAGSYITGSDSEVYRPDIRRLFRPNALTRQMRHRAETGVPPVLIAGAILFIALLASYLIQDSRAAGLTLRRITYFAPPVLATMVGMGMASLYSRDVMLNLIQLTAVEPLDVWIALLQNVVIRMRWVLITFLGLFLLTGLNTLNKLMDVRQWQVGMPEILVIFAWLGMILLGAGVGISAGLHRRRGDASGLAPAIVLAVALVVLPIALGELGPRGWQSSAANLVAFSLIPYMGLIELMRYEAEQGLIAL
jgi:hypothetical protein